MVSAERTLADILAGGLFTDGDWIESKDQDKNGDVRLIQLADIGDGVFRNRSSRFLTATKARELDCTFLAPGDVLVARMPEPLGRACVFPGVDRPAVTAVDVCILRPDPKEVDSRWLAAAINSPQFRSSMAEFIRGTTRQRISRKNLGSLSLSVPPLAEQQRIVARLEKINNVVSTAEERVTDARRVTTNARRSVLAAACSGRLTADWRPRDPAADTDVEDESRPDSTKRDSILQSVALPRSWKWARLSDLATAIEYGYTASSTRDPIGPKLLRITDIQDEAVDWESVPYCRIDPSDLKKYRLAKGDLVFARTGATTGKSYLLRSEPPESVFASYLIRVRLSPTVNTDYIYAFFRSPLYWRQIEDASAGTGQPNVNGTKLARLSVPLPPIGEQVEIARRADVLLRIADSIDGRLGAAEDRLARVPAAVLDEVVGVQALGSS